MLLYASSRCCAEGPKRQPLAAVVSPEVRECIRDAKPRTTTTRGGQGKGRAIRRPHYRVIANLRTGFLGLRRDFAQIEPKSDLSLT